MSTDRRVEYYIDPNRLGVWGLAMVAEDGGGGKGDEAALVMVAVWCSRPKPQSSTAGSARQRIARIAMSVITHLYGNGESEGIPVLGRPSGSYARSATSHA